ncbi:branched-chain amino acid transport system substrate-binding protein [Nitrobacteraceae bacterium AZCC 2161]
MKVISKFKSLLFIVMFASGAVPVHAADTPALPHSIKIGVLNDRSGPYADAAGEGSAVAARMAAEEFGNTILGVPVEILVGDHMGKVDVGALITRKWFDTENVDVVADIANSGVGFAVVNLAKERNKIVLNNSASSDFTGKACSSTAVQWSYNTYANGNAFSAAMKRAGLDSIFTIGVDYAYGRMLGADFKRFVEKSGSTLVGEVWHPLNTADFSSFLLQAQASKAKAVALADSGADLVGILKQADEFRIGKQQTLVVLASINLSEIEALGLPIAQGLMTMSAFEWNRTDESRRWTKNFVARTGKIPTADQAATYSEVKHYLKAVAAARSLDTATVLAKMRELPVNDAFAANGRLREDGQMVHDLYLVRVKKPSESTEKGDYISIVQELPGDEIFQSLAESACPLLKK